MDLIVGAAEKHVDFNAVGQVDGLFSLIEACGPSGKTCQKEDMQ